MRLYAPLYEGDSVLRPDAALGEPVFRTPASATDFVRSNIQMDAANETVLDLRAVEDAAKAMRGAEIVRLFKAAYTAVADWFERIDQFERDQFFASSENLADLEQRQRHWERTGQAHY